ncbi:MAG TPA: hypothetical protein VNO79_13710 [Actinomycetota bacterium]|nr:hypothetical protein [Actinomycetota bacterium]
MGSGSRGEVRQTVSLLLFATVALVFPPGVALLVLRLFGRVLG